MNRLTLAIRQWWEKASRTTAIVARGVQTWGAVWTPVNYEALAKEGFQANVTVYRCVLEKAAAVGGLKWRAYRRIGGKLKAQDDSPLQRLLDRPNPGQGQSEFFQAVSAFLNLSGNAYIELSGPDTGPRRGQPIELFTLRPDRVRVIPSEVELVGGYEYRMNGQRTTFEREAIVHVRLFHPTDDFYGLSPIAVAARVIDQDNAAVKWNVTLIQNAARPFGGIKVAQTLTGGQYKRMRAQIRDLYQGHEKAGTPLILEGGAEWVQMGMSPVDLDWLAGRKLSKREICQVFQVPGELVGDQEAKTYSNYQEARKSFYLETVMPEAALIADQLTTAIGPAFGDGWVVDFDRDQIEAIQEEREKLWTRAATATHLTINEKRAMTGYEPLPGAVGDVVLVSGAMIPLDMIREGLDAEEDIDDTGAEPSGGGG